MATVVASAPLQQQHQPNQNSGTSSSSNNKTQKIIRKIEIIHSQIMAAEMKTSYFMAFWRARVSLHILKMAHSINDKMILM